MRRLLNINKARAKKSLGQNFIIDDNFLLKMSSHIDSSRNNIVIEIGPGKGALTKYLIKTNFKKLLLIEKDNNLASQLKLKYKTIKNVFVINSVENRISVGNNVNMYLLSFTTSELVKNQRTKINKVLSGTYSDIVENMLKTLDCQKQIFIEPTSGVKRIVAPNVTPFSVIGMALKDSTERRSANWSTEQTVLQVITNPI